MVLQAPPGEASNSVEERGPLTRERIAAEALMLIDQGGLHALSMRKLGAVLGVEAMSIYHYVTSKGDLLDAVLELLYAKIEIAELSAHQEWEHVFRHAIASFHAVLLAHPNTVTLFANRPAAMNREGFGVFFGGYRAMRRAGLSPDEAHNLVRLAVSFVLGIAVLRAGGVERPRSFDLLDADLLEDPAVAEFVLSGRRLTEVTLFERGLDLLVAGLRSEFGLP